MALRSIPSDETLVTRIVAQDQEALAQLFDRYRAVIFSLALRILRNRAEAEEVLTDVFLQAWRTAPGFDRARGSVSSWLVTLCRSRAIDRVRSARRREAAVAVLLVEESAKSGNVGTGGPEEELQVLEKRRRITAALEALSPDQRQALELAYYGGFSHTQVAARLGEPLGTVKTRIRQALLTLRERLGGRSER